MFFSVVIPTLNEKQFLPKLLKSLSRQIDRDFEVLVVDGHSEDDTPQVASKFTKSLPSLRLVNSKLRSVAFQRNLGGYKATGKYLIFLDADTIVPSNYISQIHHYFSDKNSHCNLLTTWMKPDTTNRSDQILCSLTNIILEISKTTNKPFLPGFNIVVKKSAFDKIGGFDANLKMSEDHDLARRFRKMHVRIYILRDPQITISFRRFHREGTLRILRKYAEVVAKYFLESPITRDMFDYPMGGKVSRKSTPSGRRATASSDSIF